MEYVQAFSCNFPLQMYFENQKFVNEKPSGLNHHVDIAAKQVKALVRCAGKAKSARTFGTC